MSKPVDLVATQISETEQRREDAWAALKKMHDQANGLIVDEFKLMASGGWCAPTETFYDDILIDIPAYTQMNAGGKTVFHVRDITP